MLVITHLYFAEQCISFLCMTLNITIVASRVVVYRYNMTSFAICLNELTPGLKQKLAPTDSRLRPDQHALEEGIYDQVSFCLLFGMTS